MTDPADCGPVTLAFCQDVQAEAYDWPAEFFARKEWHRRRPRPGTRELKVAADALGGAKRPIIIAGGGVLYAEATGALKAFAEKHNVPVGETQAGKSSLPHDHPLNLGSIGVTGSSATNAVAESADVVLAVGTRLQDFTTGSWALFRDPDRRIVAVNVATYDAHKHNALPLIADAKLALEELSALLGDRRFPDSGALKAEWTAAVDAVTAAPEGNALPTDMQVIGAVNRAVGEDAIVVCAAGGLPGELHKLWRAARPNGYHLEYGFSTMGYEIAGGLGVKMAHPDREVVVMLGDGSYMMMNSELATSVMLGLKLIVVILDNRGFGCINRLQLATGGASFNNLLDTARHARPLGHRLRRPRRRHGRHRREGRRDLRPGSRHEARPRSERQLRRRHRHRPDGHHRGRRRLVGRRRPRGLHPRDRARGAQGLRSAARAATAGGLR